MELWKRRHTSSRYMWCPVPPRTECTICSRISSSLWYDENCQTPELLSPACPFCRMQCEFGYHGREHPSRRRPVSSEHLPRGKFRAIHRQSADQPPSTISQRELRQGSSKDRTVGLQAAPPAARALHRRPCADLPVGVSQALHVTRPHPHVDPHADPQLDPPPPAPRPGFD